MRLSDYGDNTYSQFGEDGMLARIFCDLDITVGMCVEFGAGDGLSCSNTARLWRDLGWKALLVESDHARYEDLEGNAGPYNTACIRDFVAASGPSSITAILQARGIEHVDFMSIDIDGDDYFVFAYMTVRPTVISIEFNPTIPPHIDLRQPVEGGNFGASLLSLVRLGQALGYLFIGASYANAFFVDAKARPDAATIFSAYETDLRSLFPPENYTYAVTDYAGRMVLAGKALPWEAKEQYVMPLEGSVVYPPSTNVQQIRRGFESVFGPAWWLTPDGLSEEVLTRLLRDTNPPLVCIDLSNANIDAVQWMWETARVHTFQTVLVGRVLGIFH